MHNKNIVLGVTGGIAAYKAAELCRLLIRQGANLRVVMTPSAIEFVQPLTFQALTGEVVLTELFSADAENAMDHIDLARWADLLLIAPATASSLAKFADGYADNLLLTIALAANCKIAVAPAMNQQMYLNSATQNNIDKLKRRGVMVWGPDEGEQACGETGPGRMLEPTHLSELVDINFAPGLLQGKKVMITAGPTREAIDPVRFLSNKSSGKMGYALARAAVDAGANVTLVSGPVCLTAPAEARLVNCISAEDMYSAVMGDISGQDIFIATAAVADYRIKKVAEQKIKKNDDAMVLDLVKNKDILKRVASLESKPFCVGFAAETESLEQNARAKLKNKKLDIIAANKVGSNESGFEVDMNALSVYWEGGEKQLSFQTKKSIAVELIGIIGKIVTDAEAPY